MRIFIIYTLVLISLTLILFVSYVNPKISKIMYFVDLAKESKEYINPENVNLDESEMNILIKNDKISNNINVIVTKFYNQFLSPLIKKDLNQN
tara:strand:- start:591 stop:869 length:279 start_codon:yes stop_codon:yes gene_type:complete